MGRCRRNRKYGSVPLIATARFFSGSRRGVASAGDLGADLGGGPLIVAGEIVALGGPIVRGPGEGEFVVRLGGDGQHFISPFDRPAAHEGSAVPTLRGSGDNDLGECGGCLHVRGGHGVPHGGRVPITVQLGVLVQHGHGRR